MSVISKAENGGSSISRISTFVVGSRKSITLYAILYGFTYRVNGLSIWFVVGWERIVYHIYIESETAKLSDYCHLQTFQCKDAPHWILLYTYVRFVRITYTNKR